MLSLQICAAVAAFNKSLVPQVQNCVSAMINVDKLATSAKANCTVGKFL